MSFKPKKDKIDFITRLRDKALQSPSKYKIAAAAFTKRGNLIGFQSNGVRDDLISFKGRGKHAEMSLMKKYGKKIKYIYLFRVGLGAIPRPIDPCPTCKAAAEKLGIKIISLIPGEDYEYEEGSGFCGFCE